MNKGFEEVLKIPFWLIRGLSKMKGATLSMMVTPLWRVPFLFRVHGSGADTCLSERINRSLGARDA